MVYGARRKSPIPKYLVIILGMIAIVYGGVTIAKGIKTSSDDSELNQDLAIELANNQNTQEIVYFDPFETDPDVTYIVQEGDVLSSVFKGYDIPYAEILSLDQESEDIFPLRNIQVGKSVYFYLYKDEKSSIKLKEVVYQPDSSRYIRAKQSLAGWKVTQEEIPYETRVSEAKGSIESSLYLSALDQGYDEAMILQFADIFAWDVDFALETQTGDTYKVIYEQKFLNNELVKTGKILAAEYVNRGVAFTSYYFEPKDGETEGAYYNADGQALQKAFLKAPVNFRYVSSGFSRARFHPVIGKTIPHNGVDYAAATGTPIIAIGDGVIQKAGWGGAYGNEIRLRHNGRYTSQYAHMSAFGKGISAGVRVKQGQVIGYVGSTGYSTGPHLHFGMIEYGNFINPKDVEAPEGKSIEDQYKSEFLEYIDQMKQKLDQL